MRKWFGFLILSVMVTGIVSAEAVELKGRYTLSPSGGLALPIGSFKDSLRTGFGGGLNGEYYFSNHIAFGISTGFNFFAGKELATPTQQNPDSVRVLQDSIIASLGVYSALYILPQQQISPYLKGGGGFYFALNKSEQSGAKRVETDFGLYGGGGIIYHLNPGVSVYGEALLHNIFQFNENRNYFADRRYVSLFAGARFAL